MPEIVKGYLTGIKRFGKSRAELRADKNDLIKKLAEARKLQTYAELEVALIRNQMVEITRASINLCQAHEAEKEEAIELVTEVIKLTSKRSRTSTLGNRAAALMESRNRYAPRAASSFLELVEARS